VSSSEHAYQGGGVASRGSGSPAGKAPGRAPTAGTPRPHGGATPTVKQASGARPGVGAAAPGSPRRVRLTVARIDPWSAMKLSFLLSVAIGVALVVAAGVLWTVLDGMGVFSDVNGVVGEVLSDESFDVNDYVGFGKVVSLATVIAVIDVVLMTAIATLGAFLYNIASALVGGLHVTLSDD
jgi:Transmembrane domain of unknown function (DUF3566)